MPLHTGPISELGKSVTISLPHAAVCCREACERGIAHRHRGFYDRIIEMLEPYADDTRAANAIRLAKAGKELLSPKFAYPQILGALEGV